MEGIRPGQLGLAIQLTPQAITWETPLQVVWVFPSCQGFSFYGGGGIEREFRVI